MSSPVTLQLIEKDETQNEFNSADFTNLKFVGEDQNLKAHTFTPPIVTDVNVNSTALFMPAQKSLKRNCAANALGAFAGGGRIDLRKEFHLLVKKWERETSFHSSLGEIFTNEAYQRIIGMGQDALHFIFVELRRRPGHWFYALEKIVGQDMAAGSKNFADARATWLLWGYRNNHI